MILPAMGITSEILPVFARKPIFGYRAMAYSIMGIAGLGFIVWGHHMFQSGMNPLLGTTFMISTMVIAVPSAIKVFNWLGTLWGGNIRFTTPMLNALAFVSMFVIGGLSGIFMASTPVDIFIHDTYFIVAHIHYVLFGGSLFGAFAGLYFWYPKMFGRMMNETWGKIHLFITFVTFNCVFFPMHFLGMRGMQRRIYDYTQYPHLQSLQPMNQFMTISLFVLGAAQIILDPELLPLHAPRQGRGAEPLARQHARVADVLAAAARELRARSRRSTAAPTSTARRSGPTTTGRRTSRPRARRARAGRRAHGRGPPRAPPGLHRFAVATALATLLLIFAGGLVTSTESGLSVPDWPTTYGQNMFTFPISKWVGASVSSTRTA